MSGYVDHAREQDTEFTVNVSITRKAAPRDQSTIGTYPSATPPSYETIIRNDTSATPSSKRRSGPRREWDAVAARIAARTANAHSPGKRFSGDSPNPNRVEKPSARRHKPGLSIDTNVAQSFLPPRQVNSKQQRTKQTKGLPKQREAQRMEQLDTAPRNLRTKTSSRVPAAKGELPADPISRFSPETPTILITPALDSRVSAETKPRVASSIYSRLTSGATPPVDNGTVPPLPQNSAHLVQKSQAHMASHAPSYSLTTADYGQKDRTGRESTGTAFEEDLDEKYIGRVTSSDTLFEEDNMPLTRESRLRYGDLTIDTAMLPTPHRSRGWWDLIRTPFETAKSLKFGRSPTDGERTPEVPVIPPLAYHTKSPSYEGLGLNMMPRNMHNSQALRRLESKDQLRVEPLPQLVAEHGGSNYSTLSPNEREVPFMLHLSHADQGPIPKPATQPAPPIHLSNTTAVASEKAYKFSPESNGTPESIKSDFSPVGQVIGQGKVATAKGIVSMAVQTPGQRADQIGPKFAPMSRTTGNSSRSSLSAEVVKPFPAVKPSPVLPPLPIARPQSRWPLAAPPYFAPPPTLSPRSNKGYIRSRDTDSLADYPSNTAFPPPDHQAKTGFIKRLFGKRAEGKTDEKDTKKKKKKRRMWCCCCCLLFLILIAIGVILGIVLSRQHKGSSSGQQTWFNITGYPPIPGGELTVIRPNLITSVSGCVNPAAMWSCSLPPEQQASVQPNDPDQPNFIFNIIHSNTTYSYSSPTSERKLRRSRLLSRRDDTLLQPSPGPPALDEYSFLGNTTDNDMEPFEGESTPFYITFTESSQSNARKVKRSATSTSSTVSSGSRTTSSANVIPDIATAIPKPEVNPDGTAQAANLLTYPSYQPLRLFNRGQPTEHYGFYTYYERSIFLRSVSFQNATEEQIGVVPADANGGSEENAATARCSWTDTRFKVEIWTNMANAAQILPPPNGSVVPTPGSTTLVRPGTFPYPVTITLDRHGGGLTTKMLYCYGMNDREEIIDANKQFQLENRAFGGSIVNPSKVFSNNISVSTADGGPGGIDGGTGGCKCQWANWLSN